MPEVDLGSALLRARKRAATGRDDLEVNGAAVLFGHDHLSRTQYDKLGAMTALLQRVARAWGGRDGSLNGLWTAILGAMVGTGFAPPPVGNGGWSLADGARRRLERLCRRLDGSRELVIALAEGKLPPIVVHVIERRLTVADAVALDRLRRASTTSSPSLVIAAAGAEKKKARCKEIPAGHRPSARGEDGASCPSRNVECCADRHRSQVSIARKKPVWRSPQGCMPRGENLEQKPNPGGGSNHGTVRSASPMSLILWGKMQPRFLRDTRRCRRPQTPEPCRSQEMARRLRSQPHR
jgi:hypothetical protein